MGYVKNIYVDIVLYYVEKEMTWKQQERVRNRQKKEILRKMLYVQCDSSTK